MIPAYSNPIDIYRKLLREASRTWFAEDHIEAADHFFNFCVTCVSLRDWVVKNRDMSGAQKDTYQKTWRNIGYFGACADIANSSKHFGLDPGRTSSVTGITSHIESMVAIASNGDVLPGLESNKSSFKITIENNTEVDLFTMLLSACKDWREELVSLDIADEKTPNPVEAFIECIQIAAQ